MSLFDRLVFVVSKTEDPKINKVIKEHGGYVQKKLSTRTIFFVQGYNIDDDDRLWKAAEMAIRVISPEYIYECVETGTILDIQQQACGKLEDGQNFPSFMTQEKVLRLFRPVGEGCRERDELPQSFGEFLKTERYIPSPNKTVIYIQPFRQMTVNRVTKRKHSKISNRKELEFETIVGKLQAFLKQFFRMPVSVLNEKSLVMKNGDAILKAGKYDYTISLHKSKRLDVMETIACFEQLLPRDGFCILGITDVDICEDPEDLAPLLGRATGDRAGILSVFHIISNSRTSEDNSISEHILEEPQKQPGDIHNHKTETETGGSGLKSPVKKRVKSVRPFETHSEKRKTKNEGDFMHSHVFEQGSSSNKIIPKLDKSGTNFLNAQTHRALFNTAAHETMHMFGLDHCAYYGCIMNSWSDPFLDPASNPDQVAPLHLCPIDLRKLQHSVEFDVISRYEGLRDLYRDTGIHEESFWISELLATLTP